MLKGIRNFVRTQNDYRILKKYLKSFSVTTDLFNDYSTDVKNGGAILEFYEKYGGGKAIFYNKKELYDFANALAYIAQNM